jgi:hypothetical protein
MWPGGGRCMRAVAERPRRWAGNGADLPVGAGKAVRVGAGVLRVGARVPGTSAVVRGGACSLSVMDSSCEPPLTAARGCGQPTACGKVGRWIAADGDESWP